MAQAIRLQNEQVFQVLEVQNIFKRAFEDFDMFSGDFKEAIPELEGMVKNPRTGVMMGVNKGKFEAVGIVLLPDDKFTPTPQVALFYNEGNMAMKRALVAKIVDFVAGAGYTRFRAINTTEKADSVWARAFRRAGPSDRVGSIMEFQIG